MRMPLYVSIIAIALLTAIVAGVVTVWLLPLTALVLVVTVVALAVRQRRDGHALTIERARPREPTGTVRRARDGARTANERVGQG